MMTATGLIASLVPLREPLPAALPWRRSSAGWVDEHGTAHTLEGAVVVELAIRGPGHMVQLAGRLDCTARELVSALRTLEGASAITRIDGVVDLAHRWSPR